MKHVIKESIIDYILENYIVKISIIFHWIFAAIEGLTEIPVNDLLQNTTSIISLAITGIKAIEYLSKKRHTKTTNTPPNADKKQTK